MRTKWFQHHFALADFGQEIARPNDIPLLLACLCLVEVAGARSVLFPGQSVLRIVVAKSPWQLVKCLWMILGENKL